MIISELQDLPDINELDYYQPPQKVLLCSPDYFDVIDVKNIHMTNMNGKVNTTKAVKQWENLLSTYNSLLNENFIEEISIIEGQPGLEDMVFCANQTFPWKTGTGSKKAIMSNMKHPSRQREVAHFKDFYIKKGYEILDFDKKINFEGMGDLIPHPQKRIFFGGHGFRSGNSAYEEISKLLDVPVILLQLTNENYYHLDTCFLPLDNETALVAPDAFSDKSIAILKKVFPNLIEVPEKEALNFALNAHYIISNDKKAAIIQKGNDFTVAILKKVGFRIFETETSEFIKSGGSVFCMKMMYY